VGALYYGFNVSKVTNINCRGLTKAIYILCIEHLRMLRLSGESNPGPPALQANTLCKNHSNGVLSCHSGSQLVLPQLPPKSRWGIVAECDSVACSVRVEIRPNACLCVRIAHHVGVTTM
jgi:hypothetical protein